MSLSGWPPGGWPLCCLCGWRLGSFVSGWQWCARWGLQASQGGVMMFFAGPGLWGLAEDGVIILFASGLGGVMIF